MSASSNVSHCSSGCLPQVTTFTSKRIEFQRTPAHREVYEAHFRCPVKFKATQNAVIFSKSDIELPFATYNADLLATVAPQLEAELTEQLAHKTFSEQAKGILKQLLAGQRVRGYRISRESCT